MDLLIIRHAIAEDRAEFAATGAPDDLRPITKRGRKKMRRALRGLARQVPQLDVLATSPLTRASQTADLVAKVYGLGPEAGDALIPDAAPDALLPWLREQAPDAAVAVVGHEPHLGFLIGWLLVGHNVSVVKLKKGGAVLLRFADLPAAGGARLHWSLTPKQLRALRKVK